MNGIKNAMRFVWGVIVGMSIGQIAHSPIAASNQEIINGWSFASYFVLVASGVAIFIFVLIWFVDHWDDDKKK